MGIAATVFSCQRERSSLASLLDDAEARGDIIANETDQLDRADLILTADNQSEHLLAEISITLHQHDIDPAATQARLLAKATGQPVATLVIGAQEDPGLRRREPLSLPILEPLLESRVVLRQHFFHIVQGFPQNSFVSIRPSSLSPPTKRVSLSAAHHILAAAVWGNQRVDFKSRCT